MHALIVGGGLAGLSAAASLDGWRVTLLEAKGRFGGRIHTVAGPAGPVELGAEFIHGQNESLLEAVRSAGLTVRPVSTVNRVFHDGDIEQLNPWEKLSRLTETIDPRAPDQSFAQLLESQPLGERDQKLMRAFVEGFNAADAGKLSAHAMRRADYSARQINGECQTRLQQGYGALVDSFVANLAMNGASLLNRVIVKRIRWRNGQVEMQTLHDGAPRTFHGDAAIITVPLGVLKAGTINFEPPLADKAEAIAGLEFGQVVKVTFIFSTPWWGAGDFGFIHAPNERIPTWWSVPGSNAMVGWTAGPKARLLMSLASAELESLGIEILQRLFSRSASSIRADLISTHMHDWASDPHVLGAYSYLPVNGLILPKLLGEPMDDTLFFAGEATARDAQMGTVFGALESGRRAAEELLASKEKRTGSRTREPVQ